MNTPNKLTLFRIVLAPVFLLCLLWSFRGHYILALVVFAGASLTDLLDGLLARKRDQITDFGKFLDPIADKMLTTAAFLGFIQLDIGYGIVWITMIVLGREFLVSSLRMISSGAGRVIAADRWGKAKTISQMTAILLCLALYAAADLIVGLQPLMGLLKTFCSAALWVSAGLTLISGANYMLSNRQYVDPSK